MPGPDLAHAAARVARLLDGITDDQLDVATPCEGLTVGALLEHFLGLTQAFTDAARKTPPERRAFWVRSMRSAERSAES